MSRTTPAAQPAASQTAPPAAAAVDPDVVEEDTVEEPQELPEYEPSDDDGLTSIDDVPDSELEVDDDDDEWALHGNDVDGDEEPEVVDDEVSSPEAVAAAEAAEAEEAAK